MVCRPFSSPDRSEREKASFSSHFRPWKKLFALGNRGGEKGVCACLAKVCCGQGFLKLFFMSEYHERNLEEGKTLENSSHYAQSLIIGKLSLEGKKLWVLAVIMNSIHPPRSSNRRRDKENVIRGRIFLFSFFFSWHWHLSEEGDHKNTGFKRPKITIGQKVLHFFVEELDLK